MSEIDLIIARVKLYNALEENPNKEICELTQELGRSKQWVQTWKQRFQERKANNVAADDFFCSESRARKTSSPQISEEVEHIIVEMRLTPQPNLKRVPGPRAILGLIAQDERRHSLRFPKSTSTIGEILHKHHCIATPGRPARQPEERPEPMTVWQMDFKSIGTVPAEENGKKQHVVETLNIVDKGSSILVDAVPRGDYHAQTVITTLIDVFQQQGVPRQLQFDRDPRFVGGWQADDFPSAMMRFFLALDIDISVTPARRPDKNAFVERLNRTYGEECLDLYRPATVEEVTDKTLEFKHYYNEMRPNQAISCGNRPPRTAHPTARCAARLPQEVNPDAWLTFAAKRAYQRRVNKHGSIQLGRHHYYVAKAVAHQQVLIRVQAGTQELHIFDDTGNLVKKCPIKELWHTPKADLSDFVDTISREALSEARTLAVRQRAQRRQIFA